MNGEALRYTCCNRRAHRVATAARDSNGCTTAFHCGGHSAWQQHGAVSLRGGRGGGCLQKRGCATHQQPRCNLGSCRWPAVPAVQGVKPRELPLDPAGSIGSASTSSIGGASTSTGGRSAVGSPARSASPACMAGSPPRLPPDPLEWHPNQRGPGMLELPSRLFALLLSGDG